MKRRLWNCWIAVILPLVLLSGCSDTSTEPEPEPRPGIFITPSTASLALGQRTDFLLSVENLSPPVFAVSLQISFDDSVLSGSDSLYPAASGFFGPNAVSFAQAEDSTVHVAISRVQGQTQVSGSGSLCQLRFTGRATGSCRLEIVPAELRFYDSLGTVIAIPDLEIRAATVSVF